MEGPHKLCVCAQCLSLLSAACLRTERQDSSGEVHTRTLAGSEVIGGDAPSGPGQESGTLGPWFVSAFHGRLISKHSNIFKAGIFHCESSVV